MHRPDVNRRFRRLLLEAVNRAADDLDRPRRTAAATRIQAAWKERKRRHAAVTLQRAWRAAQRAQPTCGGWWMLW